MWQYGKDVKEGVNEGQQGQRGGTHSDLWVEEVEADGTMKQRPWEDDSTDRSAKQGQHNKSPLTEKFMLFNLKKTKKVSKCSLRAKVKSRKRNNLHIFLSPL